MTLAAAFSCVGLRQASSRWRIAASPPPSRRRSDAARDARHHLVAYQKITLAPISVHPKHRRGAEWGDPRLSESESRPGDAAAAHGRFTIRVNDDSYQTPVDLSGQRAQPHPELTALRRQYDLPSRCKRLGGMLILGAGAGNDVAGALRGGARRGARGRDRPGDLAPRRAPPNAPTPMRA